MKEQDQKIFNVLEMLKSAHEDYPQQLLEKRRAALLDQLARLENPSVQDSTSPDEETVIGILENLPRDPVKYPPLLLAQRRAAFLDQIAKRRQPGPVEIFSAAIQSWSVSIKAALGSMTSDFYRSFVVVGLLTAVFAGIMIFGKDGRFTMFSGTHITEREISRPIQVSPTGISEIKETACTPDSDSDPCLAHGFKESPDQTSWVSNTANSWIRIDVGQIARINKVEMDRNDSGASTGDFIISVAQSDGQYLEVYDSKSDSSAQQVAGMETIQISFEPVLARYIKVTVVDPGVVINEVRAFAVIVPPTLTQRDEDTSVLPFPTLKPSSTPLPTDTRWPSNTPAPTSTPVPTSTPLPTDTQWPTDTPVPTVPTSTPAPTDTPLPTDTRWPTDTPVPTIPTSTPAPTDTPLPTDTRWPTPVPTDTPLATPPDSQPE